MKYEITKKYFDYILLELIEFTEKCRLCEYIDHQTIKDLYNIMNMIRYYRQFSE